MKKGLTGMAAGQTNQVTKPIKEKQKRKVMSIGATKLGVTLVLHKDECEKLGFKPEATTREVIAFVKQKLGLKEEK